MLIERKVYSHPEEDSDEEPEHLATVRVGPRSIELRWGDRLVYRSTLELWALSMMLSVPMDLERAFDSPPPPGSKYVRTTYSDGRIEHEMRSDRSAS